LAASTVLASVDGAAEWANRIQPTKPMMVFPLSLSLFYSFYFLFLFVIFFAQGVA
jgi:hypothetical protein